MLGKNEDRELTIEINGLKTYFDTYRGIVKALDGVDLKIPKGSTVGLVGETGCGKSTTALSILRLVPEPGEIREGKIIFNEEVDILELDGDELRDLRGNDIAMTFQDPKTYLNPVLKIEEQLIEPILLHQDLVPEAIDLKIQKLREKEATNHKKITKWKEEKKQYLKRSEELQEMKVKKINAEKPEKEKLKKRIEKLQRKRERATGITYSDKRKVAKKKALETLELVKMPQPAEVIKQFPHELSTGMRQRVMIATMLSSNPKLFIADEPTTALDVTIQAQILKLLNELKNQLQSSILYITHNLAVIAQICDY
ncbi:MAG: ABC transporter ATP-binding protein, partial [Candidatus Korarchaeota archaeon]|nr:ABC transporter ATP-binding protein [Candidatus Korarchaeota archaeon]NIU82762.1 ATP-binding cassette domain-containing protein [Candidatus Thorarchaeota archaeon]NIW13256.1 ATP-binding cassette domain-containing protein [Candidatus Thorarchaeota archaeon]NIW51383.1 ATP-binding cassette domain-containing protein [Candidatus Korarchaeota archaeon]